MQETKKHQMPKQATDFDILAWFFRSTLKMNVSATYITLFVLLTKVLPVNVF